MIFIKIDFSLGTFAECSCEAEVQHWMRYNIFLLLDVGTFSALVELLNMEIEYALFKPYSTLALENRIIQDRRKHSDCYS